MNYNQCEMLQTVAWLERCKPGGPRRRSHSLGLAEPGAPGLPRHSPHLLSSTWTGLGTSSLLSLEQISAAVKLMEPH